MPLNKNSNLRHEFKRQSLEIEPRFPLFGGWHTEWAQGFNQPLRFAFLHFFFPPL